MFMVICRFDSRLWFLGHGMMVVKMVFDSRFFVLVILMEIDLCCSIVF